MSLFNQKQKKPGSTSIRLAALLEREFPMWGTESIIWQPEDFVLPKGWWRSSHQADCYRWETVCRFTDGEVCHTVHSWYTMTECLKAGRLQLGKDCDVSPLTFKGKLLEICGEMEMQDYISILMRERDRANPDINFWD